MTVFYLGAVVLLFFAIIFAIWPFINTRLFRSDQSLVATDRQSTNIALYRDHLSDLEGALNQGLIDQSQFDQLKNELEHNLLEDSLELSKDNSPERSENNNQSAPQRKSATWYTLVIAVLVPVIAIVLYQLLGNATGWQLRATLAEQASLENQLAQSEGNTSLEQALIGLNRQLVNDLDEYTRKFPDDLQTKVLLARNASNIGHYDKAIEVYQQVVKVEPEAAQIMAELAQVIFLKADNRAVPVVGILAERVLSIQPNNATALGLMGIFHFQNNRYDDAITFWERAVQVYSPNSANGRALQNGIIQTRAQLANARNAEGSSPTTAESSLTIAEGSIPSAHKNLEAEVKVKVAVSLAPQVPVDPEHTVFIYARAWKGAKIPLAITRVKASELPLTLELNDSMFMAQGMNLSSAEQVEIVARLSPSGDAIARPEDWQAAIGPVVPKSLSATVYTLMIADQIKE